MARFEKNTLRVVALGVLCDFLFYISSFAYLLITPRRGPDIKHRSSVAVPFFPWEHVCLRNRYSVTAVVDLLTSRSLPSKGSTLYIIYS
jgi:hypothetical protein